MEIERRSKSRQIADDIIEQIATGIIAPGVRVPGRGEIVRTWDVGPRCAQDALIMLREEGWTVVVPRKGSYALSQSCATHPQEG